MSQDVARGEHIIGRRGAARWVTGMVLVALTVQVAVGLWPEIGRARGAPEPAGERVAAILQEVRRATRLIEGRTAVRQVYTARALGLTWEFSAWVRKEPDAILVETEGAPWFLPQRLQLDLVEAVDLLEGYRVDLAGAEMLAVLDGDESRATWVLEGRPAPGQAGGARVARFWVEQATGRVLRLALRYWWGEVHIDQSYQAVGPYTVLDRQHVRILPLGADVWVKYRDYQFATPDDSPVPGVPDGTKKAGEHHS